MPVVVAAPLEMSAEQRSELESMARSQLLPHRQVRQAKALLSAADGVANEEIARRAESTPKSVRRWRSRFEAEGVASVGRIRPGRGRPAEIDADKIEAIVTDTVGTVPDDGSVAWSTRTMGERHGVGKDTIARIWRSRGLRPGKSTRSSCRPTRTSRTRSSTSSGCI